MSLVRGLHPSLLRLARVHTPDTAVAEEVVQETWLAVLRGIDQFEGRSSVKTWIFRILVNRAITHGTRERKTIPFSAMWDPAREPSEPAVDPARFRPADDPEWPGYWATYPSSWGEDPEERLLRQEAIETIERTIQTLPPSQREVVTMRDVIGCSSREVCDTLGITEGNQRVLLHRARSRIRGTLEKYFENSGG